MSMLSQMLVEVARVKEDLYGVVYDFLKKLNADKTGEFLKQFKLFLRNELVEKAISYIVAIFTITIDEAVSVEDAVKAGKFDYSNPNITSANFPKITGDQKWNDKEVIIFYFNKTMSSEAVIAEMDKAGYKPGNIWALIGLAIREPDLQRKYPIVALGSVCGLDDRRLVPFLCEFGSERDLNLDYFVDDWRDHYRFLAVRK